MSEEKFRASLEDINILTTDALLGSGLLEQYEKEMEWVNNIPDSVFIDDSINGLFNNINARTKETFKKEMKERVRQNFFDKLNSKLQTSAMLYTKKFIM